MLYLSSVIFLQHHNFLFPVLVSALLFCAVGFLNHRNTGSANGFSVNGAGAAFHPRRQGPGARDPAPGRPRPAAREAPPPLPWSPRCHGAPAAGAVAAGAAPPPVTSGGGRWRRRGGARGLPALGRAARTLRPAGSGGAERGHGGPAPRSLRSPPP